MVLAVEIGNCRINFGTFNSELMPNTSFGIATDIKRTSDEYAIVINGIFEYYKILKEDIDGVSVCSVVPQLTDVIREAIVKLVGGVKVIVVGKGTKNGFPIKIDNPAELGTDLVANAAAVISVRNREGRSHSPCVIIDMGAATTIFALNSNNEYIGGSIVPGVKMSLEALHGNTAQLPNVTPVGPTRAIGKNSQESVRSGVVLGNAMMLDGFIRKFADEMRCNKEIEVYATGEYAELVLPFCSGEIRYIPDLTLIGLYCIFQNNINT